MVGSEFPTRQFRLGESSGQEALPALLEACLEPLLEGRLRERRPKPAAQEGQAVATASGAGVAAPERVAQASAMNNAPPCSHA